jgi:predicted amidohydrolase
MSPVLERSNKVHLMPQVKVLSAVPVQLKDFGEKLGWLRKQCEAHKPDILVTPQEFFGGAVTMPHQRDIEFDLLYPELKKLNRQYGTAFVVGVQQKDDAQVNRSAIWFINEDGEYLGRLLKLALPRYDHVSTNGFGHVTPETDFMARFKLFPICGLQLSAIFCWEVYSDILWTGLGILKPDLVLSLIKFGPNAWPQVEKVGELQTVKGFGYGTWDSNEWIQRLRIASLYQVRCPIISSTNSWNLRPVSKPICGSVAGIPGQLKEETFWEPKRGEQKAIPEHVSIDLIDAGAVQGARQNKFAYKDATGEFPPFDLGKFTMLLKMARIETRILTGREQQSVEKHAVKKDQRVGFFPR